MVKTMEYKNPEEVLGKPLKVFLRSGANFNFRAIEAGKDCINGFDDEGLDLQINMADIDFVMGG